MTRSSSEGSVKQIVVSQSNSDTETLVNDSIEQKPRPAGLVQLPEIDDSLDETLPVATPKSSRKTSRRSTVNHEIMRNHYPEYLKCS